MWSGFCDEMLEELPGERREELEALSDSYWEAGIGNAILELADSTGTIVLSICGRDRRLRIR
jgi:hypothetical protein